MRGATAPREIRLPHLSFQFTPLVRGATTILSTVLGVKCFNSRPSCEGRLVLPAVAVRHIVSIHAPRARGDEILLNVNSPVLFQFTPLVRGATHLRREHCRPVRFNSRPSCEGRPARSWRSIRTTGFNSRPSCEGRPLSAFKRVHAVVSIHAPRARGDIGITPSIGLS